MGILNTPIVPDKYEVLIDAYREISETVDNYVANQLWIVENVDPDDANSEKIYNLTTDIIIGELVEMGIELGDKLLIRDDGERIIIEVPKKIVNPSEYMWNLSKKPLDIDVVKLVEESWKEV